MDTAATGMKLVDHMLRARKGRVTFMPLDKLRPQHVSYPKEFGDAAQPLTKYIKYNAKYEKAVQQVSHDQVNDVRPSCRPCIRPLPLS